MICNILLYYTPTKMSVVSRSRYGDFIWVTIIDVWGGSYSSGAIPVLPAIPNIIVLTISPYAPHFIGKRYVIAWKYGN